MRAFAPWLVAVVAGAAGGCASIPPAEKYFDRGTPLACVTFFQYAVETKQYEAAYSCLGPEAQEEYSPLEFRLFLRFYRVKELNDTKVRKMIIGAERIPQGLEPGPGRETWGRVILLYEEPRTGGDSWAISVMLKRSDDTWRIDLRRTLEESFAIGSLPAPVADGLADTGRPWR